MLKPCRRSFLAGISLVEMLLTLSVSAVVLAMGAPLISGWLRDIEIRSSASSLYAALQMARAEAVSRNATVRLQLTNANGLPAWSIQCVHVSAQCPANIRQQTVSQSSSARWGSAMATAMPLIGSSIVAGHGLPAGVSFNAIGAAPAITSGDDIARIDITNAVSASARRLVVLIASQGMIKLCDPLAANDHPEHCS